MTTAVVTGGFGYAGGRIVRKLLNDGVTVRVSTRRRANDVPAWAVESVVWSSDLPALCENADCLVHLAAPNEIECAANPDAAITATVNLTEDAVAAARDAGVARFIYMSTVHVYGTMQGRIDETTPTDPRHPYAAAHLESEGIAAASGLDAVTLRLSNGYGAPADDGTDRWSLLVNDLCRQAVRDRRMVLTSDGMQRRDFLPLGDAAAAVAHFVSEPAHDAGHRVFNLSSGKSVRVRDMASLILQRARAMLDADIELSVPTGADEHAASDLMIDNGRLLQTGFSLSTDPADEIDGMLRFCIEAFGQNKDC